MEKISIYSGSIEEAIIVEAQIPEFGAARTVEAYLQRIADAQHLLLIAKIANKPVGYKVGYALDGQTFYSWLGGVIPEHRKLGIAQQLLTWQERWASQQGYQQIRVKSMNRYPGMLILLIKNGYQIEGVDLNQSVEELKILFCKTIAV